MRKRLRLAGRPGHAGNTSTFPQAFTARPDNSWDKTPSQEGNRSMVALWRRWLQRWQAPTYARRTRLVLVNGLAEQAETWFFNVAAWRREFDVHIPNLAVYEGIALHRRIAEGMPITVDYLV